MKSIFFLLLACLCWKGTVAQIELFAGLQSLEAPYWELLHDDQYSLLQNGYSLGITIPMPGENSPVRVTPGISLHQFYQNFTTETGKFNTELRHVGFHIPVRLYLFDLIPGCECPNYHKSAFVFAGLGASHLNMSYETPDLTLTDEAFAPYLSAGLGIVLSYSDWLKVIPQFHYRHFPAVKWEELGLAQNPDTHFFFREESPLNQLGFEINFQLFLPETKATSQ